MLYVSPERLLGNGTIDVLCILELALFAIDEAHCVSQWGHEFRPDYLELQVLHERWPDVPRIALTATATQATREEIAIRLKLAGARLFVSSFDRPNMQYRIVPKNEPKKQLLQFLRTEHPGDAGIVYCLTRDSTERVAAFLTEQRASRRCRTTPASTPARAPSTRPASCARTGSWWSPPSRSGWGSTSRTCGRRIPGAAERSRATTRSTGARAEIGCPRPPGSPTGSGCRPAAPHDRRGTRATPRTAASSRRTSTRCSRSARRGMPARPAARYFSEPSVACGNCDTCLSPPEAWDGTVPAGKLLSAVVRLGRERHQKFGTGRLIDILLGRETERVRPSPHTELKTFGIGTELGGAGVARGRPAAASPGSARRRGRRLRHAGDRRGQRRGAARGPLGHAPPRRPDAEGAARWAPLGCRRCRRWLGTAGGRGAVRERTPRSSSSSAPGAAPPLSEQSLPAYTVFQNATLRAIATARPATLAELAEINGVGEAKLAKYGEAVLDLLAGGSRGVIRAEQPQWVADNFVSVFAPRNRTNRSRKGPEVIRRWIPAPTVHEFRGENSARIGRQLWS